MKIQELFDQGVRQKDIAVQLGMHPRTVRRALRRGRAPQGPWPKRGSRLDPYKERIDALLAAGVWNVVVILRELEAQSYRGSYTTVKNYVRPKRALHAGRATVRFETEPGAQTQLDWGELFTEIAGVETKVYFSAVTLGYSRRAHAWAFERLDAEHLYESVVRAFAYFGGVTAQLLVDNPKALVRQHPQGEAAIFNERFLDLCTHYGVHPHACRPYRARTKGKDERMVGYLKHHFFVRYRSFESWAHLNQLLESWLHAEADQRVHGTVKEVVVERFVREVPALRPLPSLPFDTSYRERRCASWDGYVELRGRRYSVPAAYCGTPVNVRLSLAGEITIWNEQTQCIATHQYAAGAARDWVSVPAHHRPLWEQTLKVERRPLTTYQEAL